MTINFHSNSIEMTKKFAKAASRFGSDEYKALQEARKDYPTFKIVTVSRKPATQRDKHAFQYLRGFEGYLPTKQGVYGIQLNFHGEG